MTNFFRINMPYGIRKNSLNLWVAYNRDFLPLGFNTSNKTEMFNEDFFSEVTVYSCYGNLSEEFLKLIAGNERIVYDDNNSIQTVFLYNDDTDPVKNKSCWDAYFNKMKLLSTLKVPGPKSKFSTQRSRV